MTDTTDIPRGTLERIEAFRTYEDDWEDGHRGISDAVADKAIWLARLVGPELVFAAPFDGAIVLTRRWTWGHHPHGRSVEIQPDGLMSLVADHPLEDGVDADHDQPFDVHKAVAWLLADTRTGHVADDSTISVEDSDLADGDEIEVTTRFGAVIRGTWFVSPGGTGFLGLDGDSGRCVTLRDTDHVRVTKHAGPPCPFPMFSRVRETATGVEYRVVGWQQVDGDWVVNAEHGTDGRLLPAAALEAVPEPLVGTPVWWGGEWWVRHSGSERYEPTVGGGMVLRESMAWAEMHGAVPADRPARP